MWWFDLIVILLLLNGLFAGWHEGFFASAFRCAGLALALYLMTCAGELVPLSGLMKTGALVALFAVLLSLSEGLIHLITGHAFGRFGFPDRLLGAVVNTLFTLAMIGIVTEAILAFAPSASWILDSQSYACLADCFGDVLPDIGTLFGPDAISPPPETVTPVID